MTFSQTKTNCTPFLPESTTIGMLGSGQLGRMFSFAAQRMGYRVHVFSPESQSPAGQTSSRETVADYVDLNALGEFAKQVDLVTLEFENLPVASLRYLEKFVPVRPGPGVLEVTQHRLNEKKALSKAGFPVAPFREVRALTDLQDSFSGPTATHDFPAILKTASWGYDGKGQSRINSPNDLELAWNAVECEHAVLEAFVDFQCELSVVAVRSPTGEVVCYDPIRNEHENHILNVSVSPSGLPDNIVNQAKQLAADILSHLEVVGVMCVEMFLACDGNLVVNELAPRPHNSGHLTIEAHSTSQFEQQVRAVCGLPLGSTRQVRPAAMVNLLGDLWIPGQPDFASVMPLPDTHLHLYGKTTPNRGRKMGHITVLAENTADAVNGTNVVKNRIRAKQKDCVEKCV